MIVKTLDKSRIVFTLTTQELEDRSIHLSTFRYGTKEANDLFKSILQIAEKDFHFEAGNQQLLIEAVPLPKNELMIIICKSTTFPVLNPNHSVFADNRYDQKDTEVSYVFNELDDVLTKIDKTKLNDLYVAYEPIWAIGSGMTPSIFEIESITNYIKEYLSSKNINAKVLYGGSVNEKNIEELNNIEVLDGFLVGGASNDYNKVIKMCEIINK